jgi:hypothetical protein
MTIYSPLTNMPASWQEECKKEQAKLWGLPSAIACLKIPWT